MNFKKTKTLLAVVVSSVVLVFSFQNCTGGFSATGDSAVNAASISTDYDRGVALYATNCASCHGQIDVTTKKGRTSALINGAISSIPQMTFLSGTLSSGDVDLIALALQGPNATVTVGSKTLFACDATQVRTNTALHLSDREFGTALTALLDEFSNSSTSLLSADTEFQNDLSNLPSDVNLLNSTQQENQFLLSGQMVSGFFEATYRAATLMSTAATGLTNYPNTSKCLASSTITQACHKTFVHELATRAFRRDVATTESDAIAATIWDATMTKSDLLLETFATIASYPDFLYQAYNSGANSATAANQTVIAGLELANKLSFYLTGGPADATLRAVAASGGLDTPATFSAQVDRLMATAAGQAHLQLLFKESYGYDVGSNLQYPSAFLNGASTTGLRDAMTAEMDFFFVDEVLNKKSSFKDLMSSRNSKVTAASLATIYGASVSTSATTLGSERAGFLTRAAFLTKKASYYTSPVKRGRHMMERVLCDTLGDPPANAPTSVSESQIAGALQSTRTRYENLTMQPNTTCTVCHSRMNPYGFALEGFDPLGRKRTSENIYDTSAGTLLGTVPVNTATSMIISANGSQTSVSGSDDLMTSLGTSDKALMCFAKHVKEFEVRQAASAADYCQMNEVLNVMYGSGGTQGSIYDAIKAYVTSSSFRVWKY